MKNLTEYINENNSEIRHNKDFGVFMHANGAKLVYNDEVYVTLTEKTDDTMEIDLLQVPKENQRQHIGSQLVKSLIEYAKTVNKDIVVAAYPIENMISQESLIKFYKSCGFEEDKYASDKNILRYTINEDN